LSGVIQPQQGVAEHRRGTVQVGRREHQYCTAIGNLLTPLKVVSTMRQRFGFLPAQLAREKPVACRKATAVFRTRRLQRSNGGTQLGMTICLAIVCEKEVVVINIALATTVYRCPLVDMQEREPFRVFSELI